MPDLDLEPESFLDIDEGAVEKLVKIFDGCPGMRDIKKALVRTVRVLKVFNKTGGEITSGMAKENMPTDVLPYRVSFAFLEAVHNMKTHTNERKTSSMMYI